MGDTIDAVGEVIHRINSNSTTTTEASSDVNSNTHVLWKEYHIHGLFGVLFHTSQGFAVFLSVTAILLTIMLGIVYCICMKCFRKRKIECMDSASAIYATPSAFNPHFGKDSTNGKSKIFPHKNIITPERNIAFVVPTIPVQTQATAEAFQGSVSSKSDILKSCLDQRHYLMPPMLETQFYPQYNFEDNTAPQIGFCLSFDCATQSLQVRIIGGCNFPEEPYISYGIHVKLYPGRGNKQRTKEFVGPNPLYNQEFSFHVRGTVLQTKVLKFRVIGSTPGVIGTKRLLGIVNLGMKEIPIVNHSEVTTDFRTGQMWVDLNHPLHVKDGVRLDVSLKWNHEPKPGLLVLKIREALGLHEITEGEYTTTYVKVTLLEQGKSIKSRKTRLIRWGSVPNYDDTFVVTVPFELLTQVAFLLTLFARGRLGSKTILGKINIGPTLDPNIRSGPTSGNEIWEDMIHQPDIEISRWLQLQP